MNKTVIENLNYSFERALYHTEDALIRNCSFSGVQDGESALKESCNTVCEGCRFALRYPLWHTRHVRVEDSEFQETSRAPMWYCHDLEVKNSRISGVKALRECTGMKLTECVIRSAECGWKCREVTVTQCEVESEYFLFDGKDITVKDIKMSGKYSFQYCENTKIHHAYLDTKDAFWHGKNVTVTDSTVNGEYLGWYSDGLTFIRCHIRGTQPFCYCKNLRLIDCTMEDCDLAFEYSDVEANLIGTVTSVKNPISGTIIADRITEIILSDSVYPMGCIIKSRK